MGNFLTKKLGHLPKKPFTAKVTTITNVPSEVWDREYNLKNFKYLLLEDKEFIKTIHWTFEAGDTIGIPSKWSLYMQLDKNGDAIGVFLKLEDSPKEAGKVFADYHIQVNCKNYGEFKEWKHDKKNNFKVNNPCGWRDVLSYKTLLPHYYNSYGEKLFPNGSLTLKLHFEMYGNPISHTENWGCDKKNAELRLWTLSKSAMMDDVSKTLKTGLKSDFVIQTKDLKEFKAHRMILAARSPVFQAMLETKMKEKDTGRVEIDDISSKAMDIFLKYLYRGSLKKDWINVAEEIVYTADKYDLPLLMKFCDYGLIKACTPDSALNLIELAKRHSLKTAEVDITWFIQNKLGSILQTIPKSAN